MPDVVCDTSAIQYLYQLDLLDILPRLADRVLVPPAVVDEIEVGRAAGVPLPDLTDLEWITVQCPVSAAAIPLLTDLGPGEAQVLMLTIEQKNVIAVLDDALARRIADSWICLSPAHSDSCWMPSARGLCQRSAPCWTAFKRSVFGLHPRRER